MLHPMYDNIFNTIPISDAVKAAAADTYEELPKVEERFTGWAIRVLRELNRKTLRYNKQNAKIGIGPTGIIQLPPDLKQPIWQGFVDDCGRKVKIESATNLWQEETVKTYKNCCQKCGQSLDVCEALNTEVVTEVLPEKVTEYPYGGTPIGIDEDVVWTQTEKRTLAVDGALLIETIAPFYDPKSASVSMGKVKYTEVLDVYECGCPAPSKKNLEVVKCYCPSVYDSFLLLDPCEDECELAFQYFLDAGYGKVTGNFKFGYMLFTYLGDIPRRNGVYIMPEVSLEAVVEGIKHFRSRDRKSVPAQEKARLKQSYKEAIENMKRQIGSGLSVEDIFDIIAQPPRP